MVADNFRFAISFVKVMHLTRAMVFFRKNAVAKVWIFRFPVTGMLAILGAQRSVEN